MTTTKTQTATERLCRLMDEPKTYDWEIASAMSLPRHPQELTTIFHEKFDAPISFDKPDATFSHMDDERVAFRVSFLLSEIFELIEDGLGLKVKIGVSNDSFFEDMVEGSSNAKLTKLVLAAMQAGGKRNIVGVVDALGDINVVTNGFAVELGVNMKKIDREIFASNMTKLGEDGKPIVADGSDPAFPKGKILKGPNYLAPQIAAILGFE